MGRNRGRGDGVRRQPPDRDFVQVGLGETRTPVNANEGEVGVRGRSALSVGAELALDGDHNRAAGRSHEHERWRGVVQGRLAVRRGLFNAVTGHEHPALKGELGEPRGDNQLLT